MTEIVPLDVAPIGGGELTAYMRERLDPAYVKFHDEVMVGKPEVQDRPPRAFRAKDGASYIPGQSPPVPVGRELDIDVPRKYTRGERSVSVRVFWPAGARSAENGSRLPCLLHLHGGGWVRGSKSSELNQCTNFCVRARCVVVAVDYRLAPEDPFPAAVEDCWEAMQWIIEDARAEDGGVLGIDDKRIGVGGISAGGNLAAALSHMLLSAPYAPTDFQMRILLLVVPAVDFTAADPASGSQTWNDYPSWTENAFAPALSAAKVMWHRNLYVPNLVHRHSWHASPILAPEENFPKLPHTLVTVAELDPLRDEGIAYAKKCEAAGVHVELKVYKGMPHTAIAQDQLLEGGAQWLTDLCDALKTAFWT